MCKLRPNFNHESLVISEERIFLVKKPGKLPKFSDFQARKGDLLIKNQYPTLKIQETNNFNSLPQLILVRDLLGQL
jgi:hypothetical protein